MTREIKFRAWDGEKMLNTVPIESVTLGKQLDFQGSSLVLMQYTGLKDKNGKEIYEGDILEWEREEDSWGAGVTKVRRKVEFEKGAFFTHAEFTVKENYLPNLAAWGEIIGNLYENPELLTNQ